MRWGIFPKGVYSVGKGRCNPNIMRCNLKVYEEVFICYFPFFY